MTVAIFSMTRTKSSSLLPSIMSQDAQYSSEWRVHNSVAWMALNW
jgi:hypothetical protein